MRNRPSGAAVRASRARKTPIPNPQVLLATLDGATNTVPSFITADGPVREARFIKNSNGTLDGGVHALYTITGRSDAPGCNLAQPDFATAHRRQQHHLPHSHAAVRPGTWWKPLPTQLCKPTSRRLNPPEPHSRSAAVFNTSGNDGTITRFGWKAQNKSLLIFAGEAYNVEQGVSNELFANERSAVAGCVFNGSPEDASAMFNGNSGSPNFGTRSAPRPRCRPTS